jgi:3-oxoacyl-[acyl-carrier-protein] synthase II
MPARLNDIVLVEQGLVSAYGSGIEHCAEGLLEGRCAFRPAGEAFPPALAALPVGALPLAGHEPASSRLLALVSGLFADAGPVPADAAVYVATTVGEIGALEADVLAGAAPTGESRLTRFAQRVAEALGLPGASAQAVSSACASSTAALALAASAIRRGESECALVVGCDLASEFVLSGFSALMALDPEGARPFDAGRRGVTLGTAAAFALLMSRERAEREGRVCLGVIGGWGMTCDANHLTGPSRDGAPLAEAARAALAMAGYAPEQVAAVCAHGTGTVYNDQMELQAFRRVFGERPLPVFSVKGGMGHTLGAAGLAEALLSLEFLRRGRLPPTVGMRLPSEEAQGWVTEAACAVPQAGVVLTTNSGFGGVNAALALALGPFLQAGGVPKVGAELWAGKRAACEAERGAGVARTPNAERRTPNVEVMDAGSVPRPSESRAGGTFALPRNFGRFSAEARKAFQAVAQALGEAGLTPDAKGSLCKRVGVVAFDRDGSEAANRAYFSDYAGAGRLLGRGQLFVYTLPTSVAAECAIACRLTGPLLYVVGADAGAGSAWQDERAAGTGVSPLPGPTGTGVSPGVDACALRAARGLLADGLAEAVVLLEVTQEAASARVVF